MTTFLDTNILIYLLDAEAELHEWAVSQLEARLEVGPAVISDIVYCEFSVAMNTVEETDAAIAQLALERIRGSTEVLFRAGKAFQAYKNNNGPKNQVLPDFIIGATASVAGVPLMTANPGDFVGYFPGLQIISSPP
jgi:predicted nucleic acid-binding protein